ncbi:TAXI family TRAP transporter solute-binding subunit [Halalkalibacter nanhaiisediminis]|uniref:TRAP transporter TAXI family solute receptor n=1 Tax=Halalkalibacter nanhaiisediminis TaxID=688079 RepID=A0A562QPI5_9BACI|nr:TAXI family TRAP transporter solute-binding subunit [Halalkalibacter nanhaiisediminis]TWI58110.1 hypothetical protein IQ10_01441 [Halalkalibacter nanhaiisediminis]
MFKKFLFSLMLTFSLILLAACGGDSEADGPVDSSADSENGEATDATATEWPSNIRIGSASQGGTYYIYAGGISTLLEEHLDITSNVEVTGGPVHNLQMVNSGDLDLGLATLAPAYEAYTGTGDWTGGQTMPDLRIAFPMYTTPFVWWATEESGITELSQIEGLQVGVGPAGGTPGTYNPIIHEALELNTQNIQTGANDMASQMLDGQLDVIGFSAGTPIAIITEIEAQRDINLFGLDGEYRDRILERYPYFYEYTLPADSYNSLEEDMETVAVFNFGIVHKDANEDFVYNLVKAYHENIDQLIQTHSSAEEATVEAILNNEQVPLHPGAIRYYEEVGIELPDSVYPEE